MPEFNAREITTQAATAGAKFAASELYGRVRTMMRTTPAVAAWAQNDTFVIGTLPAGARVLPNSRILHGAFGVGTTLDVGLRETAEAGGAVVDVDKYVDGADIAAAGQKFFDTPVPADWLYVLPRDMVLYATLLTANPTDDIQALFTVLFVID